MNQVILVKKKLNDKRRKNGGEYHKFVLDDTNFQIVHMKAFEHQDSLIIHFSIEKENICKYSFGVCERIP